MSSTKNRRRHLTLVGRPDARSVAALVVARVLEEDAFASSALSNELERHRLDARERGLCTELAYGTLRFAAPLEASLLRASDKPAKGIEARCRPHLLVAAYQLQHLSERIPAHAAVNAAVETIKLERPGLQGYANAILRRLPAAPHTELSTTSSLGDIAMAYGIPDFLAAAVTDDLPRDEWLSAIAALCDRPTTYGYVLDAARADVARQPHQFVPRCVRMDDGAIGNQADFIDGSLTVMDPGSIAVAQLVGARADQRMLDACAAPGSKTLVLADAVGPRGRVVALELNARRASRIRENLARANVGDRVEVHVADALQGHDATWATGGFDAVLLDAPCSGLGTTRRRPETKLRRTLSDVAANARVQRALLDACGAHVRPGGVLVYAVCSPMPQEGAALVASWLSTGVPFVAEDPRRTLPWLPEDAVDDAGGVHFWPHRHDADAFYLVRLRRA